ncbi:hypothetical protein GWK47_018556 [Chionoecetes opilio]|nr:hypothetical protein GWK47_018556 [Chionoecetes opilio]
MVDGSGLHLHTSKQDEDLALPANSALPKVNTSTNLCADSIETCIGNIPSCYAPLPLKIGIARQGGTQSANLAKHTVASSEGLNCGDTKERGNAEQRILKVDQFSQNSKFPCVSKAGVQGHVSASRGGDYQLEDHDKMVHKKRKSVIRGLNTPAAATSTTTSQISRPPCTQQLLTRSPELQTKCS